MILRRIRFTNFDTETTDIFENEFVNRYMKHAPVEEAPKKEKEQQPETEKDEKPSQK